MMKKSILFVSLLSFVFIFSACSTPATPAIALPESTQQAEAASVPSTALFQIIKPDGTKFDVTLDAVKKLPLAQITIENKVQEGPKLLDVLSLAGITDFAEVTINGTGASSTLSRAQVDENTILDFSNRGTMKLATTYIPKADWTKDITEIIVK
jgi:hypothetical protein